MSLCNLPAFFLVSFLQNDITVNEICKLNSAFCNKKDRPTLEYLFALKCDLNSLQLNKNSVFVRSVKLTSEKIGLSIEMVVFNIDSPRSTVTQKWETLHTSMSRAINCDTTVKQMLIPAHKVQDTFVLGKEETYEQVNAMAQQKLVAFDKRVITYSTKAYNIQKIVYSCGSFVDGTYTPDDSTIVEVEFRKRNKYMEPPADGTDTDYYTGFMNGDWLSGEGIMKYHSGCVYNGEWKQDKCHGEGQRDTWEGDMFRGRWIENELDGEGFCKYANGDAYTGGFKYSAQFGHGVVKYANGEFRQQEIWSQHRKGRKSLHKW